MDKLTNQQLIDIMDAAPDSDAAEMASAEYSKRKLKADLLQAAQSIIIDVERGDMVMAAWSVRRVDNMINDEAYLAAYGFKLDNSDIMHPRLVKVSS